jgi:hypothetical protein
MMCIDKRTGRIVYKGEFVNPTSVFNILGDSEKKTVHLNLQRNTVALTFTDQAAPPEAPPEPKPTDKKSGTNAPSALWKSLQRMFGGATEEPDGDNPDGKNPDGKEPDDKAPDGKDNG